MPAPEVPTLTRFLGADAPNLMAGGPLGAALTEIEDYLRQLGAYVDEQIAAIDQQSGKTALSKVNKMVANTKLNPLQGVYFGLSDLGYETTSLSYMQNSDNNTRIWQDDGTPYGTTLNANTTLLDVLARNVANLALACPDTGTGRSLNRPLGSFVGDAEGTQISMSVLGVESGKHKSQAFVQLKEYSASQLTVEADQRAAADASLTADVEAINELTYTSLDGTAHQLNGGALDALHTDMLTQEGDLTAQNAKLTNIINSEVRLPYALSDDGTGVKDILMRMFNDDGTRGTAANLGFDRIIGSLMLAAPNGDHTRQLGWLGDNSANLLNELPVVRSSAALTWASEQGGGDGDIQTAAPEGVVAYSLTDNGITVANTTMYDVVLYGSTPYILPYQNTSDGKYDSVVVLTLDDLVNVSHGSSATVNPYSVCLLTCGDGDGDEATATPLGVRVSDIRASGVVTLANDSDYAVTLKAGYVYTLPYTSSPTSVASSLIALCLTYDQTINPNATVSIEEVAAYGDIPNVRLLATDTFTASRLSGAKSAQLRIAGTADDVLMPISVDASPR